MKYLDEFRDSELVKNLTEEIHRMTTRKWAIMEVCGGQTHSIIRYGIDTILPDSIELIHGPGCPVCVTPIEKIDAAIAIASRDEVILCSFGDMLRVPGSETDLLGVKARGGDVRTVYSPLDAVRLARKNPDREVVFFAVGFETTAPAVALAAHTAKTNGIENFSLLASHVLVPPAIRAILAAPTNRVNGFLAAGHVCTVMGFHEYPPLCREFGVPIVVTGFEPTDVLEGVLLCVRQLEENRAEVENQYTRAVRREGNEPAQQLIERVFHVVDRQWRGIGEITESGLELRPEYAELDAARRFEVTSIHVREPEVCISGLVLQGAKKPVECPAFGDRCNPENPLGAPMVSSEGACSAYYNYRGSESLPISHLEGEPS